MKKYIVAIALVFMLCAPLQTNAAIGRVAPIIDKAKPQYTYTAQATYIDWFNIRPGIHTVYAILYVCIKHYCSARPRTVWRQYVGFEFVHVVDTQKTNNYIIQ